MKKLTNEEKTILLSKLKFLKLSFASVCLQDQFENVNEDIEKSADERICEIIEAEYYGRINKKIARELVKSKIKYKNAATSFDY